MDKFEQVVLDCPKFSSIILSTPDNSEFVLLPVDSPSMGEDAAAERRARQMGFLGIIGLAADGKFRVALAEDIDERTSEAIGSAFVADIAQRAKARIAQQPKTSDSVSWLRRLFSLPDTREHTN
jgi:hypothetical protein